MTPTTTLLVRVMPRGGRDEVSGWRDGVLQVRLRAPPVEGQANDALRRLLAERLGLRLADVEVISGEKSRTKRLRVSGISDAALLDALGI
ncbi:MAG TPA: DUF167 domain-containing protein [Dehalococcoidia bacterium]|nr:DUF167 domain-containing protein [Dehalococcoidia bacterium]